MSTSSAEAFTGPRAPRRPAGQLGLDVDPEHRPGPVLEEGGVGGDVGGPGRRGLLAGLEHREQRRGQAPRARARHGADHGHQRRGVHVVAAHVRGVAPGAERQAGPLDDGQRVQLGAHGHRGRAVGGPRTEPQHRPGPGDRLRGVDI